MYKMIKVFQDVLPAYVQQKLGFEKIGEPQIPEFTQVSKRKLLETGGVSQTFFDLEPQYQNVAELIHQYNQFALIDFVEDAIDEIVDESIVMDDYDPVVEIDLDTVDINEKSKKIVIEEFNKIKRMLKFDSKADEYFRLWYVNGRIYFQILFNKNKKDGIQGFHLLSPYKVQRFYDKETSKYFYYIREDDQEYFLKHRFLDPEDMQNKDYIASSDHVIFVPSGRTDAKNNYYISHLHKAFKPANQLKLLEDSLVIYRFTRAPERRAFYIDTGRLSSTKAEAFVTSLMNKFKTKLNYDTTTGMINQNKSVMTMLEDYWLPRSGSKGTEVQTISGGTQLGEITDVLYFKRRTWKALKLPSSRADDDNQATIDFGRDDFSREELKFNRFCRKLRSKFVEILTEALRVQLIAKGICNEKEWTAIYEPELRYRWNENSYWVEQKENSILEKRLAMLREVKEYRGRYFSDEYIQKRILKQTDDEIEEISKQIKEEGLDQKTDDDNF